MDDTTRAWAVPLANVILLALAAGIKAKWNRPRDKDGRTFVEALGYRLGRLWARRQ